MAGLGLVLAAYEADTGTHPRRQVQEPTARYLAYLQSQGYELAEVERVARGLIAVERCRGRAMSGEGVNRSQWRGNDFWPPADELVTLPPLYGTERVPLVEKLIGCTTSSARVTGG